MTNEADRVTKLEEEVTHLSLANEEMSAELVSQWKRVEELEKKLLRLENRFTSLEDSLDSPIENTKPPHW